MKRASDPRTPLEATHFCTSLQGPRTLQFIQLEAEAQAERLPHMLAPDAEGMISLRIATADRSAAERDQTVMDFQPRSGDVCFNQTLVGNTSLVNDWKEPSDLNDRG